MLGTTEVKILQILPAGIPLVLVNAYTVITELNISNANSEWWWTIKVGLFNTAA